MASIINGRGSVGIRRSTVISQNSIVTDGLKLYLDAGNTSSYPGTGTVWTDISGNNYNATIFGSGGSGFATYSSANGGSILFDGTDDSASISYTIQNEFTNKITINTWVKPTRFDSGGGNSSVILGKTMPSLVDPYTIITFSISPLGKINGSVGDGISRIICTTTNTISLNTWVNLCMTYDGAIIKIYLNGVQDPTTASGNYTLGQNTVPMYIGSNQTLGGFYNYYKGNMSNIQLYNKGLSSTEVTQNYNALKGRFGL